MLPRKGWPVQSVALWWLVGDPLVEQELAKAD